MKHTRPKNLEFKPWQKIISDFPDQVSSITQVYKLNPYSSWVTIRDNLELLSEKGLITMIKNPHKTEIKLTETGKAFRKQYQMQMEMIPVVNENVELTR
jgi:predicted transcriptional regulator